MPGTCHPHDIEDGDGVEPARVGSRVAISQKVATPEGRGVRRLDVTERGAPVGVWEEGGASRQGGTRGPPGPQERSDPGEARDPRSGFWAIPNPCGSRAVNSCQYVLLRLRTKKVGGGTTFSYSGRDMPKIEFTGYTDHLGRKTGETICHAFDFARFLGYPLNLFITINLGRHDVRSHYATTVFRSIRARYRDWYCRKTTLFGPKRLDPMYVYTVENPNGMTHAHWAVHIPEAFQEEFFRKLPRWVRRSQGEVLPYDIDVSKIDPHTDKVLAKYIVKGLDPAYVPYMHLENYAAPQGRVWGRRGMASAALNRTARKRAGFVAKQDRHKWKKANFEPYDPEAKAFSELRIEPPKPCIATSRSSTHELKKGFDGAIQIRVRPLSKGFSLNSASPSF